MAVVVETAMAEDLDLGPGTTYKTHPGGGVLYGHRINLGTFSLAGVTSAATTKTWAPGDITNLSQATTTVTVPNANTGDMVIVSFGGLFGLGSALILSAYVSAASEVTVILANMTGALVTTVSGTLYVLVFRHV